MSTLQCVYRNHTVVADVFEHPGIPTPWAAGCHIIAPDGQATRRIALPVRYSFLSELGKAQQASLAHGKWLVDQCLDQGRELFKKSA